MCFANGTSDRKAVYYTTWSEPHDKMVRHLEPFGFFELDALGDRVEFRAVLAEQAAGLFAGEPAHLRELRLVRRALVVFHLGDQADHQR